MRLRASDLSLAVVLGWIPFAIAGLFTSSAPVQLGIGCLGGLATLIWARSDLVRVTAAFLDPIGIVLPILVLRQIAIAMNAPIPPFHLAELSLFAGIYLGFLLSGAGVIKADFYRLGYFPVPVGVIALLCCVYAFMSGHIVVALIAVIGQALWLLKKGSSNYFDHILHATLLPIVIVSIAISVF